MENIDSRLMGNTLRPGEEDRAARELKDRRGPSSAKAMEGEGGGEETGQRSLRQRALAARQALDLKQRAKDKIEAKITAPAKLGTSRALQWAWITLIPSFGLTLLYINLHVFLRYVFGEKLFCKLGEEWIPKQLAGAGGEAGKMANKSIGLIEVIGLAFLDLVLFFVIVGFVSLFTDESTFKTITGEADKVQPAPAVQK